MTVEMKKVIKGLECLAQIQVPTANPCKDCGYSNRQNYAICVKDIAADTLVLLKEQEPVAPQKHYNKKADLLYTCGKCRNDLKPNNRNARFCWFCGQAVKWE